MSRPPFRIYGLCLIFGLIVFHCTGIVAHARARAVFNEGATDTIVIESNRLEIDNKQNILTFTGDVAARQDTLAMQCQKMMVYFDFKRASDQKNPEQHEANVDRIVATDGVIISRPDGQATAERAIYYQKDDKIVLSGKAMLKRGAEILEGPVIIFFLKEDRITVEGSEPGRTGDVLSTQDKKGGSVGP